MTKIEVDEALLKRLIDGAERSGDSAAAGTARKLLPKALPTEVGTVIMWREDNDGGLGVGTFAEKVSEEEWRHNGFDLYRNSSMEFELQGKTWWEMVRK